MSESTITIKLGGVDVHLSPPSSVSMRWQILEAVGKQQSMGLCAALGVAWDTNRQKPLKAKPAAVQYDYARFGAMVMDELVQRYGVKARDVVAAGALAFNAYDTSDLIAEEEVADAESFTEDPEISTS